MYYPEKAIKPINLPESSQHLRYTGPADAEIAGKRGPALELAGVEQRLIVLGQLERIASACGWRIDRARMGVILQWQRLQKTVPLQSVEGKATAEAAIATRCNPADVRPAIIICERGVTDSRHRERLKAVARDQSATAGNERQGGERKRAP